MASVSARVKQAAVVAAILWLGSLVFFVSLSLQLAKTSILTTISALKSVRYFATRQVHELCESQLVLYVTSSIWFMLRPFHRVTMWARRMTMEWGYSALTMGVVFCLLAVQTGISLLVGLFAKPAGKGAGADATDGKKRHGQYYRFANTMKPTSGVGNTNNSRNYGTWSNGAAKKSPLKRDRSTSPMKPSSIPILKRASVIPESESTVNLNQTQHDEARVPPIDEVKILNDMKTLNKRMLGEISRPETQTNSQQQQH